MGIAVLFLRVLSFGALVVVCLIATGCESTQSKSAELAKQGADAINPNQVDIGGTNQQVKVLDTQLLSDQFGSAVAVTLKNTSDRFLSEVPIRLEVKDKAGKKVFVNDQEGTTPTLLGYPLMGPGQTVIWVHDQILATGEPASVDVRVGTKVGPPPVGDGIKIDISGLRLQKDPSSGIEVLGRAENTSPIDQVDLVFFCVAKSGGRVVAAGRGQVRQLSAGATRKFSSFFIGDPTRGQVECSAPPTVLN